METAILKKLTARPTEEYSSDKVSRRSACDTGCGEHGAVSRGIVAPSAQMRGDNKNFESLTSMPLPSGSLPTHSATCTIQEGDDAYAPPSDVLVHRWSQKTEGGNASTIPSKQQLQPPSSCGALREKERGRAAAQRHGRSRLSLDELDQEVDGIMRERLLARRKDCCTISPLSLSIAHDDNVLGKNDALVLNPSLPHNQNLSLSNKRPEKQPTTSSRDAGVKERKRKAVAARRKGRSAEELNHTVEQIMHEREIARRALKRKHKLKYKRQKKLRQQMQ